MSGEIPFHGDLVVEGEKARSEPVGIASPDMTFRCDAETLVLLMWGRLSYGQSSLMVGWLQTASIVWWPNSNGEGGVCVGLGVIHRPSIIVDPGNAGDPAEISG